MIRGASRRNCRFRHSSPFLAASMTCAAMIMALALAIAASASEVGTIAVFRSEMHDLAFKYEPEREARQLAERINGFLAEHPNSPEGYYLLGQAHVLAGPGVSAEESNSGDFTCGTPVDCFWTAHQLDPANRAYLLAWVEFEHPRSESAQRALTDFLEQNPDDGLACYLAATWPGASREEATALLRRSKECLPKAKLLLGELLESDGRFSEAETVYRSVFAELCGNTSGNWLDRDFLARPRCRLGVARVLQSQGKPFEALHWLQDFLMGQREFMVGFASPQEIDSLEVAIQSALPQWPIAVPTTAESPEALIEALRLATLACDQDAFFSLFSPPLKTTQDADEIQGSYRSSCIAPGSVLSADVHERACRVRDLIWVEDSDVECRLVGADSARCTILLNECRAMIGVLTMRRDRDSWRVVVRQDEEHD